MHMLIQYQVSQKTNKLLLMWLVLLFLSLASNSSVAAKDETLVLNDTNDSPYTTEAGDGFLNIVVNEVFHRAGLKLELVKLPPERGLINANAGIEDGDLTRIAGLEKKYPNLIRVPEKLMDWHFVAFSRQNKIEVASWSTLEQVLVGHIKGWKIFEQSLTAATRIVTVNNPDQLFTMLDKNRIDIALYERGLGYAFVRQKNIKAVHVIEPSLAVREMYIYLHKRHIDKVQAIVDALRAVKAEGLYGRVCHEKFAPLATFTTQCDVN